MLLESLTIPLSNMYMYLLPAIKEQNTKHFRINLASDWLSNLLMWIYNFIGADTGTKCFCDAMY